MAVERLLDALVTLDFQDNGTVAKAGQAVRAYAAEIKKIGDVPGLDIGKDLTTDLTKGIKTLGEMQDAMQRLLRTNEQASAVLKIDPANAGAAQKMENLVRQGEKLLGVLRQIDRAQAAVNRPGVISASAAIDSRIQRDIRRLEILQEKGQVNERQAGSIRTGLERGQSLRNLLDAYNLTNVAVPTLGPPPGSQSNMQRLLERWAATQPRPPETERAAQAEVDRARVQYNRAARQFNKLDSSDEGYAEAQERATSGYIRLQAAERRLEKVIEDRAKAEAEAAETARKIGNAREVRASQRFADLNTPDHREFLTSVGVDPDSDATTQRRQLAAQITQADLKINEAKSAEAVSDEQIVALTRQRAKLEVALNAAVEKEILLQEARDQTARDIGKAREVRRSPRAQVLDEDRPTFLKSVGIDPDADIATQRAQLAQAMRTIEQEEVRAKRDSATTTAEINRITKQRARLEVELAAAVQKEKDLAQAAAAKEAERIAASKDPRLGQLQLSPDQFAEARGIDTGEPLTRQRLELAMQVNAAKREEIAEEAKRIQTLRQDNATLARNARLNEQMTQLVREEMALRQQAAALAARERKAAGGGGGFLGGLFGKNEDEDGYGQGLAYSAGMTLRFYALYAGFAALQQALLGVFQMTEQYTRAVHELSVALGSSYEEAAKAGQEYTKIGAQFATGPVESIQAATKGLRSFRDSSGNEDPAAGTAFTRLAGIITTLEPEDRRQNTQQDMIAIAKAFQVGATGLEGLYDKLLVVSQQYGYSTPGEIISGVAAVSDIGKESGYTPEALASAIASVMVGTGTTSDAAAGDLKRFLGAQQDPALLRLFERYNVSQDLPFAQRLDQFIAKLDKVSPEERARDVTGLGGPRIASAINALVAGNAQAKKAEERARDSSGESAKQAEEILTTLSGAVQGFGAELKGLFVAIVNSGVGDVFIALAGAIKQTVTATRQMLELWNGLPTVLKDVVAAIVLLMAAAKAQAILAGPGGAAATGLVSRLAINGAALTPIGAFQAQRATGAAAGAYAASQGGFMAIGAAGGSMSTLNGIAGKLAVGLGTAATAALNLLKALAPMATIMAGILLVSAMWQESDKQKQQAEGVLDINNSLNTALGKQDVTGATDAIGQLKASKVEIEKGNDGFVNGVINLFSDAKEQRQFLLDAIDARIAAAEREADVYYQQQRQLDEMSPKSEWFGKNYNNITQGVALIRAKGVGTDFATGLVEDLLKQNAGVIQTALQPGEGQQGLPQLTEYIMQRIAGENSPLEQEASYAQLSAVLRNARSQVAKSGDNTQIESLRLLQNQVDRAWADSIVTTTKAKLDLLNSNYTGQQSEQQVRAVLTEGLTQAITSGSTTAIVQLLNGADKQFIENYKVVYEAQNAVLDSAQGALNTVLAAFNNSLGADQATGNIQTDLRREMQDKLHSRFGDSAGKITDPAREAQRKAFEDALKLANPQGEFLKGSDLLAIAQANEAVTAGNGQQAANAAVKAAQLKVDALIRNGKKGTAEYYDGLKALNEAKKSAADYELNRALAESASAADLVGNPLAQAKNEIDALRKRLDANEDPSEYFNLLRQLREKQRAYAEMQLQVAESKADADVLPNNPIAAATAAITQATNRMNFYRGKDDAKFYDALKSLRQSQYDLGMAQLEMANNAALLRIDITDPVAMARQRVAQAEAQLAFDRKRGAGADVLTSDEAALRQTRSDYGSTKWSQTFNDMRTNYDLNRISLSAYLQYLNSQHDYLSAVKVKTRLQVEQLNEVDSALKQLTESMNGQWNLGDIKVPTAYEMRRALAGGQAATSVSYVNIVMTGSSTAEMKAALQDAIGQPILQTAGTAAPKV